MPTAQCSCGRVAEHYLRWASKKQRFICEKCDKQLELTQLACIPNAS